MRNAGAAGKLMNTARLIRGASRSLGDVSAQRNARVLELRRYTANSDAPESQNTCTYVLSHESREAAKRSWDDFRADPSWKSLRDTTEADGLLVGKVDSIFVSPTDFSPTR